LDPFAHQNGLLFGLTMLYKRYWCNEVKRHHEEKTGEKYDLVIHTRPDIFFLRPFKPEEVQLDKLWSRQICNDFLFASSSEIMDKVTSVYTHIERIARRYKLEKPRGLAPYCTEYFLEHFFYELGLDENNRGELGEDFIWLYPRQYFGAAVYRILEKHGRLEEFRQVINYPLSRVN
jgi:hypothetical protein